MKLLLENWRMYLNEEKREKREVGSREAMEFIITQDPDQVINIDVKMGDSKAFGDATKSHLLPFNYGEYLEYINPADGDPWDLIVVPSARVEYKNLLPVGNVTYVKERGDKTGNDKIIIGSDGKFTKVDKHTIDTFFDKLPQFNKVEWYSAPTDPQKEP